MKKILIISAVLCVFIMSGCSNVDRLGEGRIQQYEMTKAGIVLHGQETYRAGYGITGDLDCIIPEHADENSEFIIYNDEQYQQLMEYKSRSSVCDDFTLPSIDFEEYTLLGKYAKGGGCSINFGHYIWKDDEKKEISYRIKVIEKGACEKLGMSMNWILIPKIQEGYKVVFEVTE